MSGSPQSAEPKAVLHQFRRPHGEQARACEPRLRVLYHNAQARIDPRFAGGKQITFEMRLGLRDIRSVHHRVNSAFKLSLSRMIPVFLLTEKRAQGIFFSRMKDSALQNAGQDIAARQR